MNRQPQPSRENPSQVKRLGWKWPVIIILKFSQPSSSRIFVYYINESSSGFQIFEMNRTNKAIYILSLGSLKVGITYFSASVVRPTTRQTLGIWAVANNNQVSFS